MNILPVNRLSAVVLKAILEVHLLNTTVCSVSDVVYVISIKYYEEYNKHNQQGSGHYDEDNIRKHVNYIVSHNLQKCKLVKYTKKNTKMNIELCKEEFKKYIPRMRGFNYKSVLEYVDKLLKKDRVMAECKRASLRVMQGKGLLSTK